MLLLVFCLALYVTGLVLSARALSRNEIKRFWRTNGIVILLAIVALMSTGYIYRSYDLLGFLLTELYAIMAYPLIVAIVALVVGIRKKLEVTIAWAALFLLLSTVIFAAIVSGI